MAEAKSTRPTGAKSSKGSKHSKEAPKLVALSDVAGEPPAQRPGAQPRRFGPLRSPLALVTALLGLALLGLLVQTQRLAGKDDDIAALTDQVEGLEAQLSAADARLASYDMRLSLIRSSVTGLVEQVGMLAELAKAEPVSAPVRADEP